jgi:osmotically-inducible protein OsmY
MEKNSSGKEWFNAEKYHKQRDSIEKAVFGALKKSPELDVSHIRVHVNGSSVTLEGTVDDPREARAMEKRVKNISGVSEVVNHLSGMRGIEL